jgi:hypothetical protein
LYYTDDHTAYASLDLIGKHQVVAHRIEEYVREDTSLSMASKDSGVMQRHGYMNQYNQYYSKVDTYSTRKLKAAMQV